MQPTLTPDEEQAVRDELEERADYISNDEVRTGTATNDIFDQVQKKLTGRGTKLVVGPRGCGKTHMMRFAQLTCADTPSHPFAVYVSFNRYYRLEPMLQYKANAIRLFQAWALANALLATVAAIKLFKPDVTESELRAVMASDPADLERVVTRLESGTSLEPELELLATTLSVHTTVSILENATQLAGRGRCVLLLDDAALTLTPDYLVEFFDIVRTLKTATISPKASVYPGTTEYGPRFHAGHEAEEVPVWLSPDDPAYEGTMQAIAEKRVPGLSLPADIADQLKYAAFGIPRAYLTMLRKCAASSRGSTQATLNATIDDHVNARLQEFKTLAKKVPRFESLVEAGDAFFRHVVEQLRDANLALADGSTKQLVVGLQEEPGQPLTQRMLSLLLEVGLIYEHPKVSHGEDRRYLRFTPHLSALMQQRAFSGKQRGTSARAIVEFLRRSQAKHPLRRTLNTILSADELTKIRLSLPPCAKCSTARLSENQRFCHQCGAELLAASTFANYLKFPLVEVPGLTEWQRTKIPQFTGLRTIGDLLAYKDPGSELRKIPWVGPARATNMLQLVNAHVDEFFS